MRGIIKGRGLVIIAWVALRQVYCLRHRIWRSLSGMPAESECLQWNSTLNFQTLKKTVDQLDGVCLQ